MNKTNGTITINSVLKVIDNKILKFPYTKHRKAKLKNNLIKSLKLLNQVENPAITKTPNKPIKLIIKKMIILIVRDLETKNIILCFLFLKNKTLYQSILGTKLLPII